MTPGRKHHPLLNVLKVALILLAAQEIHSYPRQWDELPGRRYSDDDASGYYDESDSIPAYQSKDTTIGPRSLPRIDKREESAERRIGFSVKSEREALAFVFPDQRGRKNRLQEVDEMKRPRNCQDMTFCEEIPDYPEDLVNRAIQKNPNLNNCANIDVVNLPQRVDVNDEAPLCVSTEQIVFPKAAETINHEWMYVVNSPNFTQGVRIELCAEENARCKMIDGFAEGYVTVCKQRYIYRQLAAITEVGAMAPELFRLPSSCCCHVRFTGNSPQDFLSRIGVNRGRQSQDMTLAIARTPTKL